MSDPIPGRPKKSFALSWSAMAILLTVLVQLPHLNNERFEQNKVIVWDVQEYYMYLPAAIIYHDLDFHFADRLPKELKEHYWFDHLPGGHGLGRMSLGMSIAYLPFFLCGQLTAWIKGAPMDGFSRPYQFFILISGLMYCLMGLIFLRKTLQKYFPEYAVAITLLTLGLATNLYYYTTYEGAMSHAVLFGFFCLYLYFVDRWYEKGGYLSAFFLAFSLGLSILIRPISILAAFIFLLYKVKDINGIKERISFLTGRYRHLLFMLLVMLLLSLPQLLYWHRQTGHFIYYSYKNEGFFFSNPQLIRGLFSYRKGWLVYTPAMALALAGFFFLYRLRQEFFYAILLFTLLNIYVVFSWWCWWYGGSFGMRALIESYAFLSMPLAAFWTYMLKEKIGTSVFLLLTAGAIWLNLFQSWQYSRAMIHWDSMTKEAYWSVFAKEKWPPQETLDPPNYEAAMQGLPE